MKFLQHYPPTLLDQVRKLLDSQGLGPLLLRKYPSPHAVRSDRALYDFVMDLKATHLRSSDPLSKICFDGKLQTVAQALGTHTAISRVQGGKLKAKREIRIATLFKEAPADFLRMIVVHELAHLKQREHDKAFYALCQHMEPDYHQLEFDLRLWLTARELPSPPQ